MKIIITIILATDIGFWRGFLFGVTATKHVTAEHLLHLPEKYTRQEQEACVITTDLYYALKRYSISREAVEQSRRLALLMCNAPVGEEVDVLAEA